MNIARIRRKNQQTRNSPIPIWSCELVSHPSRVPPNLSWRARAMDFDRSSCHHIATTPAKSKQQRRQSEAMGSNKFMRNNVKSNSQRPRLTGYRYNGSIPSLIWTAYEGLFMMKQRRKGINEVMMCGVPNKSSPRRLFYGVSPVTNVNIYQRKNVGMIYGNCNRCENHS